MGILSNIQAALKGKPKTQEQLIIEKEEQDRRKLEADEYRRQQHEANMRQTKVRATREARVQAAAPPPRSIKEKAWNFMTTAPANNPFTAEMGGSPRGGKMRSSRKEASPFSGDMGGGFGGGFGGGESNPFMEKPRATTHKKKSKKGRR